MRNTLQALAVYARGVAAAITGRNHIASRTMFMGYRPNSSGSRVTEQSALTYTAYWRAVSFLSSTLAHLPIDIFHRAGGVRTRVDNAAADYLLNVQASDELPAFAAREATQAHVLTWGGGYAEIEQVKLTGEPVFTHLITPERVLVDRTNDGRLVYVVSVPSEPNKAMRPDQILHIRGLAYDGVIGYSPVALFRNAVGMGMSAEQYGASFFGNGAHPGGVLETDKNFDERPEVLERIRSSWAEMHQGPSNAHRVAILEDGLKWAGVGMPHTDAQFLENRKFQVTEMARIFNLPPFVVGDLERSTNNNIEAQAIELVVYGLIPWVKRWESEIDVKLLRRRETGMYCRMNLGALLRGDSVARGNFYDRMFRMGVFSPNDIRTYEDLEPVPNGDVRLVPMNMVRLDQAGTQVSTGATGAIPGGDGVTPNQTLAIASMVRDSCGDVAEQMLSRHARKAGRATERHAVRLAGDAAGFRVWAEDFWRDHTREMIDELGVVVGGLARALAVHRSCSPGATAAATTQALEAWVNAYRDSYFAASVKAHAGGTDAVTLMTSNDTSHADAAALVEAVWNSVGA